MLKPLHHPRWLLVLCVAALMLIGPAAALAAGGGGRAPTHVVPVWAFLNDGSPVTGGRVVIMAGGRPVRQLHPSASGITNASGVALVLVTRVPRRYTVVVRGGRVNGRRLPGRLQSVTASGTGVVEVDPLTSLVAQLRRREPSLRFGPASRLVKRYFGVPGWADLGDNVREGPDWFSAREYVGEARRYGSTVRLNRAVALRILRGGSRFPRSSDGPQLSAAPGATGSGSAADSAIPVVAGLGDLTPGALVGKVFQSLLQTGVGFGANKVVGGVLGGLLQLASQRLGIEPAKSELAQVSDQLDAIGAQLTELKGQVSRVQLGIAQSDASRLLHLSDGLIGSINYAREQLAVLAASNLTAEGRKGLAADIQEHIRQHLLAAPQHFAELLDPAFSIASNPIKAVSHALGSSGFFDARKSNEVRAVYNYYATYQVQLVVLLTNYWNTKPDSYQVPDQLEMIRKIFASVTKVERESLKAIVPAGTFMWVYAPFGESALTVITENHQTRRNLTVGGFGNYQMPSFYDFKNLLRGATGDPRAWLQRQVEVPLTNRLVWGSEGIRTERNTTTRGRYDPSCNVIVDIFDLETDAVQPAGSAAADHQCSTVFSDPNIRTFLQSKSGGLMLLRYLAADERYYW